MLLLHLVQLKIALFQDQAHQRPLVILDLRLGVVLEGFGIQRHALKLYFTRFLEGFSHLLTNNAHEDNVKHSAHDPLAVEIPAGLFKLLGHRMHEHIVARMFSLLLIDLLEANL